MSPETGKRRREDKVVTVSTSLPGDGRDGRDGRDGPDARRPEPLDFGELSRAVTTHVAEEAKATARDAAGLGPLARAEADRRGYGQAAVVIGMGDGGNRLRP